jgi:phosphonopyruvate decarboxylase
MEIEDFGAVLEHHGVIRGAGVPCSYFGPLFHYIATRSQFQYVSAANEGEAVAIACGMTAAGVRAFVLMQNSGLGNAVNPITSLVVPYGIPLTLFISHRGQPGLFDEPQHERMGAITEDLVRLCGLRCHVFAPDTFYRDLCAALDARAPTAWILRKGALRGESNVSASSVELMRRGTPHIRRPHRGRMTREDALTHLLPLLAEDATDAPAVIATTGMLSRELFELDDCDHSRRNRFYMVGSMGCAASFGLGVALTCPRRVIVLDGDGALLMRMGTLATIGALAPRALHHVVLDNGAHDTTGGQATSSPWVDFEAVAAACGYRHTATVSESAEMVDRVAAHLSSDGPTFVRIAITPGHRADVGRPTLKPRTNWERFASWLAGPFTRSA